MLSSGWGPFFEVLSWAVARGSNRVNSELQLCHQLKNCETSSKFKLLTTEELKLETPFRIPV